MKKITILLFSLLLAGVVSAQFLQTDWSGGGGQTVFTDPTMFNSSYHVDYSSSPGDLIADNSNKIHVYGVADYNGKLLVSTSWYGTFIYDPVTTGWEFSHIAPLISYKNNTIHTDGKLYVMNYPNIFSYDGTNSDYGMGPNGWTLHSNIKHLGLNSVYTLQSAQGKLLIGCRGGVGMSNYTARVLEWNENANTWNQLGNTFTNAVCALMEYQGTIYAGTHWSGYVYKWTGSSWVHAYSTSSMSIVDLEVHDGYLYAAGAYDHRRGRLYKYNGSTNQQIHYISGARVYDLESHNNVLTFTYGYTNSVNKVMQYDGSTVSGLYSYNGEKSSQQLCSFEGDLYYGGCWGTTHSMMYKNGQDFETIYVKGVQSSEFSTNNGLLNVDATCVAGNGVKVFVQGKNNSTYNASPWIEIPDGEAVPISEDVMRYWAVLYTVGEGAAPTLHEISIGAQAPTDPLVLNIVSQTDVSCFDGNDGYVEVLATGGTPPYTYDLNGVNTNTSNSLIAGTYNISVTDIDGEVSVVVALISEPDALAVSLSWMNISCNGGSDGTIDLTVSGGTTPYSYLWSNGSTEEDLSGLIACLYSVTVTDANGCTFGTSATLSEPDAIVASLTWTNISCNSGNDGTIDLTVNGGTMPYSYLWSNGSTEEDLGGLTAGLYSVTVTDANGCSFGTSATLSEPDALAASLTWTNISCNSGNDGTIDLTVSGGTTPYSYLWSNGSIEEDLSGLIAGSYDVTITDANGCNSTTSVILTEPDPVIAYAGEDAVVYYGYDPMASTQLSASGGITYSWSPVEGLDDPTISNPVANPTVTTIYTVTVTDQDGCSNTDDVMVEVIDVRCGKNMNKVLVCHNNNTICISKNAVAAHLNHGDYLGNCHGNKMGEIVQNIDTELDVNVFPNPFAGHFQIELTTNKSASINIQIYDLQGRLYATIFDGNVEAGEHAYYYDDNSTLNKKGIYLLRVTSDSEVKTFKLIRN